VLCAGALHPGLTRADLAWFHDERRTLAAWLEDLPEDRVLGACTGEVARRVADIATWSVPVSLPLLTKVLHRKRPKLIPLLDRHVVEWYRPITGQGSPRKAWPDIVAAMRDDLEFANAVMLMSIAGAVRRQTYDQLSVLRVMDIIMWMAGRP
jgi:hypothetical protein